MIMPPRVRKFALTAHVISSVGWLGAVLVFLALSVVGLTSKDEQTVRGAYLVMEQAAWYVLVPLAFASLLTGIVQSLGTTWGIFRHYWVIFKLLITVFATFVLLVYMGTFRYGRRGGGYECRSRHRAERIPEAPRRARPSGIARSCGARGIQAPRCDAVRPA